MRFYGIAVVATALIAGACAGGDKPAADSAALTTDTAAVAAATPAVPAVAGTAAPITGTTHEVKMVGDATGYRFEPAAITVKAGDGVKFMMVSGGPHNVAFDAAQIPADTKAQLDANISEKMGELSSAMKMNAGESITVSLANIKAGTYAYNCVPHLAMNMKGTITVQ